MTRCARMRERSAHDPERLAHAVLGGAQRSALGALVDAARSPAYGVLK